MSSVWGTLQAHGQVVLFGGFDLSGRLNDTWVWDGINWTQKFPSSSPSLRLNHAMTYDAAHGQVVLFGGAGDSLLEAGDILLNDTWVWDGTNWTQKFPSSSPTPRYRPAMAYDAAKGQVVLFGGDTPNILWNDTWVWDGTNWMQKFPSSSPSVRRDHAMTYDAAHGQVVLFGGFFGGAEGGSPLNDTWVWK